MIDIDEMHQMLDEIAEEFPEAFYETLNGGINLLPQAKRNPEVEDLRLYVLGEYCHDAMGRYINLYYGSFRQVFGHLDSNALRKELKRTLAHEFTHHVESLAGERSLERKDDEQMEAFRRMAEEES